MTLTEKPCTLCKLTKPAADFRPDKRLKSGLFSWCRTCCAARERERGAKRRTHDKPGRPPKLAVNGKLACGSCKEVKPATDEHFAVDAGTPSGRRSRCKTCDAAAATGYYKTHRTVRIANARAWNKANGKRRWASTKADVQQRLSNYLRSRLYNAIKRQLGGVHAKQATSAVRDLGCTILELITYLEQRFQPGMSWENYGEWHIDHIKPLAKFDLTVRLEALKACHFTNLQPLWGPENIAKGDS